LLTLSFRFSCPNSHINAKSERGGWYAEKWAEIYLTGAKERLQKHLHGLDLTIEDIYIMQQLCPYETVALGYSKFCELFTKEEWEGFDYACVWLFFNIHLLALQLIRLVYLT